MAGHHHRAFHMRRVEPQIRDQRLAKSLHREFRSAIGGVRYAEANRSPEAVDARGVDDVRLIRLDEQRQEGADAEIDAAPADVEGALPLLARIGEQAAAASDAGIVEQEMDLVGLLLLDELVAE